MKIGVLGLGFMGSTHLKALKNIPQAELAMVADLDEKRLTGDLSGIQGNIGGPGEKMDFSSLQRYTDLKTAVQDPAVEAVDICLPTSFHADVTIRALEAGKHVLVEKPMALDGASVDRMIEVAGKSGRVLMTAQVLRFFPAYRVMADTVKSGKLGPVHAAIFRRRCAAPDWSPWMDKKDISGGGVFDLLIHDVDFCLHMFGVPETVSAVGHEDMPKGIDWITAQFHYPGIGGVALSGGWHHYKSFPFSMEYTVVCEEGTIEYSSAGTPPTLYRANGEKESLTVPEKDAYQAELEYFLDCCINGRKPEFCPPQESAASVKLARLMADAREKRGEKVACRF
jgi:predicted dehydrogenase